MKLGLEDTVRLLTKTKEISIKYQDADYFCLPSFYEGTPNVLCEAISCGLPVMASNVCDNSLYVHENENGILFNPSDPEDIANKVFSLMSQDGESYQSFRNKSRQIAESVLSKSVFLKKYLYILGNHE